MVTVGSERNAAAGVNAGSRMLEAEHCRVAARTFNGVEEQLVVVLREYPARVGQEFEQFRAGIDRHGRRFRSHRASLGIKCGWLRDRTVVERCVFVQRCGGDIAQHFAVEAIHDAEPTTVGVTRRGTVGDMTDD